MLRCGAKAASSFSLAIYSMSPFVDTNCARRLVAAKVLSQSPIGTKSMFSDKRLKLLQHHSGDLPPGCHGHTLKLHEQQQLTLFACHSGFPSLST